MQPQKKHKRMHYTCILHVNELSPNPPANVTMSKRIRSSLSSSKQLLLPPSQGGADYSSCRQLVVVPPTITAALTTCPRSRFWLPDGWRVEEVPRANASHIDRYYYEPATGRKFRSLVAVQRHIRGEECTPISRVVVSRKSSRYRKIIITNGKMLRLNEEVSDQNQLAILASSRTAKPSPYNLPDGWVVEEVPRRSDKATDKYYYEPGTGRKFRSHIAVQRHLAEVSEDRPLSITFEVLKDDAPLAKMFKNSATWKKEVSRENMQNSSFLGPPKRINWVISSPQGDAWNPFVGETLVPDSVKEQWSKRLILVMNDGNDNQGLR